ncbi:MAG: hypothetical protein JKX97_03610 [Candidatus Lindowbacteria bacterium]|nr:hypothetical protein [Candidatus Lindowbacteria bacterium]
MNILKTAITVFILVVSLLGCASAPDSPEENSPFTVGKVGVADNYKITEFTTTLSQVPPDLRKLEALADAEILEEARIEEENRRVREAEWRAAEIVRLAEEKKQREYRAEVERKAYLTSGVQRPVD